MRDIEQYTMDYNVANFEDYQIIFRRRKILEFLNKHQPRRILEIGCGMEPLFQFIDFDYDVYVTVDPSEVFIDNAKKKADGNERISFINECFVATDELRQKKFDCVICASLLHEMERPLELLKEIYDVCSSETLVHIDVPNANSFHRILAKEMGLIDDVHDMSERNKLYQQHSVYDMDMLRKSIEQVGFTEVESGSYFIKLFTHGQMYQMMQDGIINIDVLDGLYSMIQYLPEYGSEIYVNVKKDLGVCKMPKQIIGKEVFKWSTN